MGQSDMIGLAVGKRSITAASVQKHGSQLALDQFVCMSFPDVSITRSSTPIEDFLRILGRKRGKQHLRVGVSSSHMVLRILHMPPMPDTEMRQVLIGELDDYAVLSGGEVVLDFKRLQQTDVPSDWDVLVGAIPHTYSQSYYEGLKQAGLTPVGIDIAHLAALRAAIGPEILGPDRPPTMALLVGSEMSYAVGLRQGGLFFLHPMDIGSLCLEQPAGVEDLLREFQLCWNYYHADFQDAPSFERVLLLIDAPNANEICTLLSQTIPVNHVELADPMTHVSEVNCSIDGWEEHLFSTAVAVGLAIGDTDRTSLPGTLNLLPRQAMSLAQLKPQLTRLGWIIAAIVAIVAGVHLHYTAELRELTVQHQVIEQQTRELETSALQSVLELKQEVGELEQRLATYESFLSTYQAQRKSFLLTWLGNSVPRETWFTRLNCDSRGNVVFEGHSSTQEGAFQFLDLVRQSSYFRSPQFTLKQNERDSDRGVAFTLKCKLQKSSVSEVRTTSNETSQHTS